MAGTMFILSVVAMVAFFTAAGVPEAGFLLAVPLLLLGGIISAIASAFRRPVY